MKDPDKWYVVIPDKGKEEWAYSEERVMKFVEAITGIPEEFIKKVEKTKTGARVQFEARVNAKDWSFFAGRGEGE